MLERLVGSHSDYKSANSHWNVSKASIIFYKITITYESHP